MYERYSGRQLCNTPIAALAIDFLESQNADLLILQEVDLNARRTKRVNVAEEIARQLGMNYVFGREFEELTQDSPTSPAYHGQATLSRWPLAHPRLIRFHRQSNFWRPRWFLPRTEPFEERLGGRIALVTQIEGAGRGLTVYKHALRKPEATTIFARHSSTRSCRMLQSLHLGRQLCWLAI
jgi:endonuclease/exonuclease/phosphatase family metal-dependent hydrolase